MRADLDAWSSFWFWILVASTIMVAIGIICEAPEIWQTVEFGRKTVERIREFWYIRLRKIDLNGLERLCPELITKNHHNRQWIAKIGFIGWVFVALGVMGEGVSEYFVNDAETNIRAFDETLLADAQTKAAFAIGRASQNEREAAQLRKDAEAEHLARVKIEAGVAFRSLDDQQKRDIGTALTRFGSITGASIWFANGSTEAELFADDIADALRSVRIHTTTVGGIMEMREGGKWDAPIESANTGVDISSTSNPVARELADALFKELTIRGFDAKRQPDQKSQNNPPGPVIWITVQAHPKGPQGEYKLQAEREGKHKNNIQKSPQN